MRRAIIAVGHDWSVLGVACGSAVAQQVVEQIIGLIQRNDSPKFLSADLENLAIDIVLLVAGCDPCFTVDGHSLESRLGDGEVEVEREVLSVDGEPDAEERQTGDNDIAVYRRNV